MLQISIGERISFFRKKKGLTVTELAKIIDVSPSTISNYENNKTLPSADNVALLAVALDTTMNEIISGILDNAT